jgi:hypothetical protein
MYLTVVLLSSFVVPVSPQAMITPFYVRESYSAPIAIGGVSVMMDFGSNRMRKKEHDNMDRKRIEMKQRDFNPEGMALL